MDTVTPVKKDVYSVWALPPEELTPRLKKLMEGLRSEVGGPQFEPHVTVVGAISLTEEEARDRFSKSCKDLKAYNATVDKVATGTFFYQCVYLLLHTTPESAAIWCWNKSITQVLCKFGRKLIEVGARCSADCEVVKSEMAIQECGRCFEMCYELEM